MILTGSEIAKVRKARRIAIEPYSATQLFRKSHDFRLGTQLGVPVTNGGALEFGVIDLPVDGFVLEPRTMYLGHTLEKLEVTRMRCG